MSVEYYYQVAKGLIIEQLRGIYVSQVQLLFIVGALVILVPGFVFRRVKGGLSKRGIITTYFIFVYVGIILLITVFRREAGTRSGKVETHLNFGNIKGNWYNLRQSAYCALNVLMFVPFGFLVRILRWDDRAAKGAIMTTFISFMLSSGVEVIQLLSKTGTFEVTDLVTNTSGGFIGAVLGCLIVFCIGKRKKHYEKRNV